jgi:hypothetical protein
MRYGADRPLCIAQAMRYGADRSLAQAMRYGLLTIQSADSVVTYASSRTVVHLQSPFSSYTALTYTWCIFKHLSNSMHPLG